MKIWITKYALTNGIREAEGTGVSDGMASVRGPHLTEYYHGRDWHKTREAAVARAEEMRTAKIASLQKSIAKLEKLRFA